MTSYGRPFNLTRRGFLGGVAAAAVAPSWLAACGGDEEEATPTTAAPEDVGAPATTLLEDPASALSGDLRILMWSHFVPSHDQWFDGFARDWGQAVGVNVTVDHINTAEVPGQITSQIAAGSGHDLIQHISAIPQFEPSVLDMTNVVTEAESRYGEMLDVCRRSSFNPNTEKFFAYAPGWAPDPGNYRRSLWDAVGLPDGPSTWEELLEGGKEIRSSQGIQLGIGMSQEIDSNMAGLALHVVLRRLRPGRRRERGHQLPRDHRRGRVHGRAVQRGDDRGGLRLERRVQQPGHGVRGAVLHPELDLGLPDGSGAEPRRGRRRVLRAGPRGPGHRAGRPARALQLDRPQPRRQPRRGPGVPAPLHRPTTPTPRTTRSSTTSRPSSSGSPTSTPGSGRTPSAPRPPTSSGS